QLGRSRPRGRGTGMRKRLLLWSAVVLAVCLAGVLLVPENRLVLRGWLRGEPFFHGRPAGSWGEAILSDPEMKARKELVDGGAEAVPVVAHLLRHPDGSVRAQAAILLGWIGPPAASEVPA